MSNAVAQMLAILKEKVRPLAARTIWSYGPDDLVRWLRAQGIREGDTLTVHASWRAHSGFQGKPADVVRALQTTVGSDGLLVMMSMPYHNMSSAEWLARGKPMDVRRSPSMMGLVSESFRRAEGVVRSENVSHPMLAWGRGAEDFVAGHGEAERPFGPQSPFAKLLERNTWILGLDASFSSFTFTHFVEDRLEATLPVRLYEPECRRGVLIDHNGTAREQWVRVLSAEANRARREDRLVAQLKHLGTLREGRLGNTTLVWIRAADLLAGAEALLACGSHFFDAPSHDNSLSH